MTWTHPNKTVKRQIDYILVSDRFRNCVRNCRSDRNWYANPNNIGQQRNAIILQFQLRFQQKSTIRAKNEKNTLTSYNVQNLRDHPERLQNFLERERQELTNKLDTKGLDSDQIITKVEEVMKKTLEVLYPKTEQSQDKRDRMFNKAATPEQQKQKTDLTERIAHHDKKIKAMDRNNAGMQKKCI